MNFAAVLPITSWFEHLKSPGAWRPLGGPAPQARRALLEPGEPAARQPAWRAPPAVSLWADAALAAPLLDSLLGDCRRRSRLAAVLLIEVLPANAGTAPALMQAMGQRLRGRLRTGDELAQLGADRFVILLLDAGDRASPGVRNRLQAELHEPYRLGTCLVRPLLRIGRAVPGLDGNHAADLLKAAALPLR